MPPLQPRFAAPFRPPPDALARLRWWALLWAVWTMVAVLQATVVTIALEGGIRVFLHSLMVFGSATWLWVATTPFVVELSRRVEWRGIRAAPRHAAGVLALHGAVLLFVAVLHTFWWRFVIREFANQRADVPFLQSLVGRFDTHLFTYAAIVIAVYAAGHWRRLLEIREGAARVEAQLVATRLHVLMMQLQPHFLFNTLHSISELVHRDGDGARRTLAQLRDLLQFSFDRATRAEVPLADEMRFLETYMEIQRMRFGDRLTIEVDVAPDAARALVPCLVLQPLVENAIRHGTAPLGAPGHIRISAVRDGERLELRVEDNGRGPGTARREGQGLRNTRIRLSELYGSRQDLRLSAREQGGTAAIVSLPFRELEQSASGSVRDVVRDEEAATPSHWRRAVIRAALVIVGAWTFFGLLWTAQMASAVHIGNFPPPPFRAILQPNLVNAGLWALLTALIIPAVRRWPARREGWPGRLAIHAMLALAVSGSLLAARWLLIGAPRPVITLAQAGWLGWDMMVYCVIAAYTHAAMLVRQRRERGARLAWLDAELATAKLDALKWHLQPQFLIDSLDSIAKVSTLDANRADDMTASLGTLLRLMLQHVDTGESTVARELEMAQVYLDLQRLRSDSRLTVAVSVSPEAAEASLPGMLLLPIVEDFIGAAGPHSHSLGSLHVTLDARRARGAVALTVRCEETVRAAMQRGAAGSSGDSAAALPAVGLLRVRSRLAAAHGDRCRVTVEDDGPRSRGIVIEIPTRPAPDVTVPALQVAGGGR